LASNRKLLKEKYGYDIHQKYPEIDEYALHKECKNQCRPSVVVQYIEVYPQTLAMNESFCSLEPRSVVTGLPLHWLLRNQFSSFNLALMMIDKYPAALQYMINGLPLHIECRNQCRSVIISKCIELYPKALAEMDEKGYLPLHSLLANALLSSSIDDALVMIEKYPAAVKLELRLQGILPIHLECMNRCRPTIISKCIELYPESLDNNTILTILRKINKSNFNAYASVLSTLFTVRPMSLYDRDTFVGDDLRLKSTYRRRILNLLPGHVFLDSLIHDADYRDLNWDSREAMMMLLSQMKMMIQQQRRQQQLQLQESSLHMNSALAQLSIIEEEDDDDDIISSIGK
jgi:hypothetical protein